MHDKRKCMAVSGKGARNLRCAFTGSVTIGGLWLCKVHAQLYEEILHTDGQDAARRRIMLGVQSRSDRVRERTKGLEWLLQKHRRRRRISRRLAQRVRRRSPPRPL